MAREGDVHVVQVEELLKGITKVVCNAVAAGDAATGPKLSCNRAMNIYIYRYGSYLDIFDMVARTAMLLTGANELPMPAFELPAFELQFLWRTHVSDASVVTHGDNTTKGSHWYWHSQCPAFGVSRNSPTTIYCGRLTSVDGTVEVGYNPGRERPVDSCQIRNHKAAAHKCR